MFMAVVVSLREDQTVVRVCLVVGEVITPSRNYLKISRTESGLWIHHSPRKAEEKDDTLYEDTRISSWASETATASQWLLSPEEAQVLLEFLLAIVESEQWKRINLIKSHWIGCPFCPLIPLYFSSAPELAGCSFVFVVVYEIHPTWLFNWESQATQSLWAH